MLSDWQMGRLHVLVRIKTSNELLVEPWWEFQMSYERSQVLSYALKRI